MISEPSRIDLLGEIHCTRRLGAGFLDLAQADKGNGVLRPAQCAVPHVRRIIGAVGSTEVLDAAREISGVEIAAGSLAMQLTLGDPVQPARRVLRPGTLVQIERL